MKMILITLWMITLVACGGESEIPKKASKELYSRYLKAREVIWTKDEGMYFAIFDHNNISKEAVFSSWGNWLSTSYEVSEKNLLDCIKNEINTNYNWASIADIEFVEKPDSKLFYITIEIDSSIDENNIEYSEQDDSVPKFSKNIRLMFNKDCSFFGEE